MNPAVDPRANPLAGNPLLTKADLQRAVVDLVEPLLPHMSSGGARVRLGSFGAAFPTRVAELEGYARPLWGLVPLLAGGGEFAHWDRWVAGLAAGTDPDGPEYWGPCGDLIDQRMVEMAAIGFALAFVPERLWDPLTGTQRDNVVVWLRGIERGEPAPNNWQFFRLLVQMGLERVGVDIDTDVQSRSIDLLDNYHLGDGWYVDGAMANIDWYLPFAFHTYGLILAASGLGDRAAADRYVERARAFAPDFQRWFGPDGAAVPWGRSLTYRFAMGSMWGALAMADVEAMPWPVVKGHALRHLRWWSERPISDRDGVVSVGYAYDNRALSESYNSAGSPYWCMKAFTLLATPDDHPIWTADEAEPDDPEVWSQPQGGMVLATDSEQAVAFMARARPALPFPEQAEAKYRKLAYSSRFGFSGMIPSPFGRSITDSVLVVTDPASGAFGVRDGVTVAAVDDDLVFSRWSPLAGVRVDTVVAAGAPWHRRVHQVTTDREVVLTEAGFALPWEPEGFGAPSAAGDVPGRAVARSPWGASIVADAVLPGAAARVADVKRLAPNANAIHPHTAVPVVEVTVGAGVHILACAVGVSGDPDFASAAAPAISDRIMERLTAFAATADPELPGVLPAGSFARRAPTHRRSGRGMTAVPATATGPRGDRDVRRFSSRSPPTGPSTGRRSRG